MKQPKFPIYIPSRSRWDSMATHKLLIQSGISNFFIVVEPGDQEFEYTHAGFGENLLVLPEQNKGLFYSRQFCKDHSTEAGDRYHWQLDDDIRSFLSRNPGEKTGHPSASDALCAIEHEVLKYTNIGQAGMNQNSFPPGVSPIKVNHLPVQAFMVNNRVESKFRTRIMNDFDFTLQVLREGWCTFMFDHIRTNTPAIGTNKGGLHEVYKNRKVIVETMEFMCKEFGTMTIDEDEKGPHLRKNRIFSTFKQQPE